MAIFLIETEAAEAKVRVDAISVKILLGQKTRDIWLLHTDFKID